MTESCQVRCIILQNRFISTLNLAICVSSARCFLRTSFRDSTPTNMNQSIEATSLPCLAINLLIHNLEEFRLLHIRSIRCRWLVVAGKHNHNLQSASSLWSPFAIAMQFLLPMPLMRTLQAFRNSSSRSQVSSGSSNYLTR